jgi:hypothetical protein
MRPKTPHVVPRSRKTIRSSCFSSSGPRISR